MKKLELEIVSPEGSLYKGEVHSLTAPGVEGNFGMLYGHIPFCTALRDGVISVNVEEEAKDKLVFNISGGIIQLFRNQVTALVEIERERNEE